MSERAKNFMNEVWNQRNNGSNTEEKLVSSILLLAAEKIKSYTAQNDLVVLDKNELIELAKEISSLSNTNS